MIDKSPFISPLRRLSGNLGYLGDSLVSCALETHTIHTLDTPEGNRKPTCEQHVSLHLYLILFSVNLMHSSGHG